ncbi:MAG: peptidylprolyl isomerase [Chloroflexota bacterium]|nr:peptidylprolyl isomerase [Chloroflexota bacterium]
MEDEIPQWDTPFPILIDPACDYRAVIETSRGPVEVDLYEDEAPITVNNFVALSESGFYDGIAFHRVIPGFVAQAGDPLGTGAGGPGYTFEDEFTTPALRHDRPGILSMANAGPNTNGSQFFITYAPAPHLDPFDESGELRPCGQPGVSCHAIFGVVTEGMENVEALTPVEPGQSGTPDVIETVTIVAD